MNFRIKTKSLTEKLLLAHVLFYGIYLLADRITQKKHNDKIVKPADKIKRECFFRWE